MNGLINLVSIDAQYAGEGIEDFEERARACMKAALGHWAVRDDATQFNGAVAALAELSNEEERQRIITTMTAYQTVSAMISGVSVNLDSITEVADELFPLVQWWEEIKKEK